MSATLEHIILFAFYAFSIVMALFLILPILFFLIHWLLPRKNFPDRKYPIVTEKNFDFAAIITAHQDTRFIKPLVDSFLKQNYKEFTVYIVADDCDIEGFEFDDERIYIIKPEPSLHAKILSIKYAVDRFVRNHDVLIIFDSDNLVHPNYLSVVNDHFRRGFRAVQTHMLSKNTDTVYAKLDSIGHIYNTFMERQIKMELGLSSAILGLGIALERKLYDEIFYKDTLGGFDKKLQAELLKRIPQIGFAENAIVYDEKVESGKALEKQRTRWI
ncbi:MAG: glycosyltransferase, partial [Flavisolibacter sp.]